MCQSVRVDIAVFSLTTLDSFREHEGVFFSLCFREHEGKFWKIGLGFDVDDEGRRTRLASI